MKYPTVALRDCRHCLAWQYDEDTGQVKERHGKPLRRLGRTPCSLPANKEQRAMGWTTGCPKGHWTQPIELSRRNLKAWGHYLECKATGNFPDDPIVRQNAGIIRAVEDAQERQKRDELLVMMKAVTKGALR